MGMWWFLGLGCTVSLEEQNWGGQVLTGTSAVACHQDRRPPKPPKSHTYTADGPITTNEDFFLIYAFHLT